MSSTGRSSLPPPTEAPLDAPVMPGTEPTVAAAPATLPTVRPVPMLPWRLLSIGGLAAAAALVGLQMIRVFNGHERSSMLGWGSLVAVIIGLAALLVWTWMVVENARVLLAPAMTQAPPEPNIVVTTWGVPLVVAIGTGCVGVYLQRRLLLPEEDTSSGVPLLVAAGGLLATLLLSIRPLNAISSALRRLGGPALPVARMIWVPGALVLIGAASIAAMRAGQMFGDDFDGIAPGWAIAVVMVLPVAVGLSAMWRGAVAAEDTVRLAFDRRNGVVRTGVRDRPSLATRLLRAEAFPRMPRADSKRIRLVPGAGALRLAMFIGLIALCLVAIIGALVMVLFWRESRNGLLVPAQEERAWDVLTNLQNIQRWLALGTLGITTLWAFVSVMNARLATGRRRNPILAAAAWPAAAWGIWWIAGRIVGEDATVVIAGFVAQAIVFAVPFFLLERAAVAVQVHRAPLRLSYALGVVLLVMNQGLFGLATLERSSELRDFGPLAGSLAVAAMLQLVASLSVTESSRLIADAAADLADDHNALVERQGNVVATERNTAVPVAYNPSDLVAAQAADVSDGTTSESHDSQVG